MNGIAPAPAVPSGVYLSREDGGAWRVVWPDGVARSVAESHALLDSLRLLTVLANAPGACPEQVTQSCFPKTAETGGGCEARAPEGTSGGAIGRAYFCAANVRECHNTNNSGAD